MMYWNPLRAAVKKKTKKKNSPFKLWAFFNKTQSVDGGRRGHNPAVTAEANVVSSSLATLSL